MSQAIKHEVSIVIPSFGKSPYLAEVVEALQAQTILPREILIVHSGNVSIDPPISKFELVELIKSSERLFAGAARNKGAAQACSSLLAFVDADCVPGPYWLANLLNAYERHQSALTLGSVGCHISGGYWGMCRWLWEFSAITPKRHSGKLAGHGASCNMLIAKETFKACGGFDPAFRMAQDKKLFLNISDQFSAPYFEASAQVGHVNVPGFWKNFLHCYQLGSWSVLADKANLAAIGLARRLVTKPYLSWLAAFWRWLRLILRSVSMPETLYLLPGASIYALIWGAGYFRGSLLKKNSID